MTDQFWRLPDGVDEWLPPGARQLELLRRAVLDLCHAWGYDYIEPPLVEYLDSLTVPGSDLELQTFKFMDRPSGRMLGLRADMTAQAARVDAHSLSTDGPQRLCYSGNIVHANASAVLASRVPLIAGAELFGSSGVAADAEVVELLLEALALGGVDAPVLVLGHVGIYQSIVAGTSLSTSAQERLFQAVQNKSEPDIEATLANAGAGADVLRHVAALPGLIGRKDILDAARQALAGAPDDVGRAIDELAGLAERLERSHASIELRFDLAELAGYGYHTGPVFSAYTSDFGRALAKGGRYDRVGARFGRERAATGFDVNLKDLLACRSAAAVAEGAIWVHDVDADPQIRSLVATLRADGDRVLIALGDRDQRPAHCDRELVRTSSGWQVVPVRG